LIVGVGGKEKSPIPKFDHDGREIGVWGPQDVPQENRSGPPPPDAASRPGYHPRYAPFGAAVAEGNEHLSSVRVDHLKALAKQTGLAFANLATTRDLTGALQSAAHSRSVEVSTDVSSYPAAAALLMIFLIAAILPGAERACAWIRSPH
jgi:mxaL protein